MEIIIIIIIAIFIISATSGKNKKKKKRNQTYTRNTTSQNSKPIQKTSPTPKISVTPPPYKPSNISVDDDIIDITNERYNLNTVPKQERKVDRYNVPYWGHQYIYSYSELNYATSEQKKFYGLFKDAFLNGNYWDLQGNMNYAFILLFDLLNEYDNNHKDASLLEKQLDALGSHYPRTKSYYISFLIKRLEIVGDEESISRVIDNNPHDYYGYDYWKTGNRYKKKLNLNNEEVELLNRLWYPSNNFCEIEYCRIEILKLYLALFKSLEKEYEKLNTSIDEVFKHIADIYVKKQHGYRRGSSNYNYSMDETLRYFLNNIFKHCENEVREYYNHKRKLNTDLSLHIPEANIEYEKTVVPVILEVLPQLVTTTVKQPDKETDIELYTQNTTRWKIKFSFLVDNYNGDSAKFLNDIIELGNLNTKNLSVENIFYEASKFISKSNPETALILYLYYLYYDLKSVTFDNKQLTKTIQKSLFKNEEQIKDFQNIIKDFIQDKDLKKAIKAVPNIYKAKRKKIVVDRSAIKEVQEQHSETVVLLNEYLQDESNEVTINTEDINSEEIKIEITPKHTLQQNDKFITDIELTLIQVETLNLFEKNGLSISFEEFDIFVKEKGLFRNQLIDSVNEVCYDLLDDVLIEEEENFYVIDKEYYNTILTK